jgi:hypothetical protein
MEKFTYKYGFAKIEVSLARDAISYKSKTLQAAEITGYGLEIISPGRSSGRQFGLVGAVIASAMTKNKYTQFEKELNTTAPFTEIPSRMATLVIGYKKLDQPHDAKPKAFNLVLNLKDQECLRMLDTLKKHFPSKYVGIGMTSMVTKKLGISMKGMIIGIIVFLVVITAIIVGATIASS